jgi:outer membrane biosynthesis protein TonB
MKPASDSKRLLASLLVSCLLHAALVFMPYLGVSTSASRPGVQGGQKLEPARILNATLALDKIPAVTVAEDSTEGASVADSSTHRMANEEPRPALDRALGIGLLPIPAPTYYTTDQLTKRPQPTAEAELDTPEIWPIVASGTIILKLWISELGDVIAVDVEKTDLPEIFSRTAVAAFKQLHFVPGELNGRRVGTMMRIEVTYDDGRKPPP